MVEIIASETPVGESSALYKQFVQLLCDVFHGPCRDLCEIRHLVVLLFPCYAAPVARGEVSLYTSKKMLIMTQYLCNTRYDIS